MFKTTECVVFRRRGAGSSFRDDAFFFSDCDSTRPMWFPRPKRHSSGTGTRMRTAYAASLLGGMRTSIGTQFKSSGLDDATFRAYQTETTAAVKAIITVRPSQPLLDCLVRGTTRLFVPHFADGDAERNRDHHRNRDRTEARGTRVQRTTRRQSGHAGPRAIRGACAAARTNHRWRDHLRSYPYGARVGDRYITTPGYFFSNLVRRRATSSATSAPARIFIRKL